MNAEVFNQTHILFDDTATTQDEAFQVIAQYAFLKKLLTACVKKYLKKLTACR